MVLEVKGVYHNIIRVSKGGDGIRIGNHVLGVDIPARTIRGLAMFATFLSSHNYDLKGASLSFSARRHDLWDHGALEPRGNATGRCPTSGWER